MKEDISQRLNEVLLSTVAVLDTVQLRLRHLTLVFFFLVLPCLEIRILLKLWGFVDQGISYISQVVKEDE